MHVNKGLSSPSTATRVHAVATMQTAGQSAVQLVAVGRIILPPEGDCNDLRCRLAGTVQSCSRSAPREHCQIRHHSRHQLLSLFITRGANSSSHSQGHSIACTDSSCTCSAGHNPVAATATAPGQLQLIHKHLAQILESAALEPQTAPAMHKTHSCTHVVHAHSETRPKDILHCYIKQQHSIKTKISHAQ